MWNQLLNFFSSWIYVSKFLHERKKMLKDAYEWKVVFISTFVCLLPQNGL